jgi:murein DD-endopeptidase MepM/ murein hydrolase activator NlpD
MRTVLAFVLLLVTSGCSVVRPHNPAHPDRIYTVAKGDTLEAIARRADVSVEELAVANGIKNPKSIRVGQIIKVPSVGPLSQDGRLRKASGGTSGKMVSISHVKSYVGELAFPVRGAQFTSSFGWRGQRFHEGADFAAAEGTPIYAAHSGTVVFVNESHGRYGRIVVVQGDGLITVYGHNSRNRVSLGDSVVRGEHIADVGETGRATGPHLHFETRVQNEEGRYAAVDPHVFFVELDS